VIDVVTHLDVDRSAADVFAFVSDQLNAPRWQSGLHEVRRTTDGPIGVGSEHVFVPRFAGRRIESRNRFVEFEPGRYVAFEIPDGAMTGRASYLVEPIDAGRCHVTSAMRFRFTGWVRIAEPLLARVVRRDSQRDEQALKRLLEAAPA
jgi:Polyketide cyclase / dehydrase and lipid transport